MSGEARRAELAAFLRAQRARLRPGDVGLPADLEPGRRRTPGLRREEVAELAGVSLTWYTWLEQGRSIAASPQVLDALARVLRLDDGQHRHLRRLAGLADPAGARSSPAELTRLQRLVDSLQPSLAVIHDGRFDFVVWNEAFARVRADPLLLPADRRNLLWMMFTDDRNRAVLRSWERVARAVLSQYRALVGTRPDDMRLKEVVAGLTGASEDFRTWWAEYPVRDFQPTTIGIDHPVAGAIDLELHQLRVVENPELLLVVHIPVTEVDRDRVTLLLNNSG